mgnify:CR=1 FL=1
MTKAKWVHKADPKFGSFGFCGQYTWNTMDRWLKVTCPKCLAKKPKKKQAKTDLYFVLDGSVSLVEKKENGDEVSKEKLDSLLVLRCLNDLLEKGLKTQLQWATYGKEASNEKNRPR